MSVSFPGTAGRYMACSSSYGLTKHGVYTICAWAKPANTTVDKDLFTFLPMGVSQKTPIVRFARTAIGKIIGVDYDGAESSDLGAYGTTTWYHSAFTQNGAGFNKVTYYAKPEGGSYTTGIQYGASSSAAFTAFNLARYWDGSTEYNTFAGEICCVRIWGAVLDSTELAAEAASATPVRTANLISSYRLQTYTNDAAGYQDGTGTNHLTPAGAGIATGSTEPTWSGASAAIPKLAGPFGGPFKRLI